MKGKEKKKRKRRTVLPPVAVTEWGVCGRRTGNFLSNEASLCFDSWSVSQMQTQIQFVWSMGSTRMAPLPGWKDRKRIAKHLHCIMNHTC